MKTKVDVDRYTGSVNVDIFGTVKLTLTERDIFSWLSNCDDPNVLRRLSKAARNRAFAIEDPDDDDFRSRA